ncbi:hypothetical protein SUGI_1027510 [Cryptomeria japonica]|nr:hypothetical protein SUGI_1027510 [Cryptomeria japonica]
MKEADKESELGSTSSITIPSELPDYFGIQTDMEVTVPLLYYMNKTDIRICRYCQDWQPAQARHCHECDKCVMGYDHHCTFLQICVGQGNHCKFWWFLWEETVVCSWTAAMYILSIREHVLKKLWWQSSIEIILVIVLTGILIFVLLLLIFHTYLVLSNQTTYDFVERGQERSLGTDIQHREDHSFSFRLFRNIYHFCCKKDNYL